MDFLLSFRSFGTQKKLKPTKLLKSEDSPYKKTFLVKFSLLSVYSPFWQGAQIAGVFYRFVNTTYALAFLQGEKIPVVDDYLSGIVDLFYFADVLSAIIYRSKWPKASRELQPYSSQLSKLVWRNRLYYPRRIWMLIVDVISLIPLRIALYWLPPNTSPSYFRFPPALRIYRIPCFFVEGLNKISFRVHNLLKVFVKFGIIWLTISHSLTCLWHLISLKSSDFRNHPDMDAKVYNKSKQWDQYLVIFYYLQNGIMNIGMGDIAPTSNTERIFMTVAVCLGFMLFFGYLISSLTSVLQDNARRLMTLRLRLNFMDLELRQRKVPSTIREKFMKFYRSLWSTRQGIGRSDTMLDSLPESLSTTVYYDIFLPALNASILFRSCDEYCKRAIAKYMQISLFMAGDVILRRTEVNARMFYIRKGTVQILSYQDDETQVKTFGADSVFGQIALLLSLPAKSELSAATFCEIHTLSRRNLCRVLSDYPKAKELVLNTHKNLLLNVMADKYEQESHNIAPGNVLTVNSFYKVPIEAAKLARDDICVVTTCPYIYVPDTIFMKVWNTFLTIIVVIIAFYYPYCAVFAREYPKLAEPFIIIVDVILIFNIYLSFSTAFIKENILFSTLREITASKILALSTYIDLISILPIHYFLSNKNRVKPVFLCLRVLQIYRIQLIFRSVEYTVDMSLVQLFRLIKFVLYFLYGGYTFGLIYYVQACYDSCKPESWYANDEVTIRVNSPVWSSLYFAILIMSGTGYGDISANCVQDMVYVILFGLLGFVLLIYLISEYSAYLGLNRVPRQNFMELAERVMMFLMSHKMLTGEKIRVRHFLNLQWERNMGYEFTANLDLFHDTPKHLLKEAKMSTRSRGIQNLELFKGMGDGTLTSVLDHAYRKVFPPHEVVIYAGEMCNSMMIIEEGFCELTSGKDASEKTIFGAGKDICTVELLLGLTSLCHVRTLTHCIILNIEGERLNRAFMLNPLAAKELQMFIDEFKNLPVVLEIQKTRPIRLHLAVRSLVQKSLYRFRYYRKQGGNKELREPYLKIGLCQCLRFVLRGMTVLPYGKLLKHWELSRCVFAYVSAMMFPLLPYWDLEVPALYYFAICLDITAWLDMYFRLHVCYYNQRRILVSHPLSTCGHYLKGSFILDFIFSFPFDRVMYRPVYDSKGMALVTNTSVNILRLLRVGQMYRLPGAVNNMGIDHLSPPKLFWILIMMMTLTSVFLNFLTSILILYCLNYKKSRSGDKFEIEISPKFKDYFEALLDKYKYTTNPFCLYVMMFYWVSVTTFNVGFGDITAPNTDLMIYVILVIIASYLYFNYVTIVIASYLSSMNMNLTVYQKRMHHLIQYLKEEKVETLLRQHIINHFEHIWKKTKGMKAQLVFANFNLALKDDVMLHLYEETLKEVEAFSHLNPSFFRVLSSHLFEMSFMAGAGIYKHGDIISDMFIIHVGEVTLVGANEDETVILGPSKVFGLLENVPRGIVDVTAVATKNVTILMIQTVKLYELFLKTHVITKEDAEAEKRKLREALIKSTEENTGQSEDTAKKLIRTKGIHWFVRQTFKVSKYIMTVYVILSLFSANYVTYHLAFLAANDYILAAIVYPVEVIFALKIILGFTTGYVDDTGEFVTDLGKIKARYMRITGFYLDIFTVLPFDLISYAFPNDRVYVGAWLKMTKLLRLYHVWVFFNLKFDTLNVNMLFLKIIAVAVWTGTLLHQCSCIWYLISCPRNHCPNSVTWNSISMGKWKDKYVPCLYFVVIVVSTTGIADITAHTITEMLFVIVLSFVAFFYTAIFIGQMVSTAQKSLFAKTNYEFEVESLKMFLRVNNVSHETQKRTCQYLANLWRNQKGQQIPDLLRGAPAYLIHEIKFSTYGHHINENPILRRCSPFFRKQLINHLLRTIYYPNDVIVYEGEVNRTTYFVHIGMVESRDYANELPVEIHEKNSYFGLRQGVRQSEPHTKTFYAKTFCIIISLRLTEWSFLSDFYPDDVKYILAQTE